MKKKSFFCFLFIFSIHLFAQIEQPIFLKSEVDQLPENYGGKPEFIRFINEQLIYPSTALEKKIEGKVMIVFLCNELGEITKFNIQASENELLNNEAIRLFKLLKWHPAHKNKKPISFHHFIEIQFSIKKHNKQLKRKHTCLLVNIPEDSTFTIYLKADQPAEYEFGKDSLVKFISAELEYPHEALLQNIEGDVKLGFIVEKNGLVSNIHLLKQLGGGCQEEAIRVLAETKWKPAIKNGKRVRFQMDYTFYFKLNNQVKDNLMKSQSNSQY
jgi:TonB family protein